MLLKFKHVVLNTHLTTWAGCVGQSVSSFCYLLDVSEREEGVLALNLPIGPFKNLLWVGVSTEM